MLMNQSDIIINNINPQNIGISQKDEQVITIDSGSIIVGISDVLVNNVSVVDEGIAYVNVPTKTSELINNSGFLTNETDPTVPSYIKNITQADIVNWNSKQALLVSGSNIKTINSNSLLGSGNIEIEGNTYTAGDGISIENNVITNEITSYNDLTDLPTIPTKTSDLVNNNDFVSENELSDVAFSGSYVDLSNTPDIPTDVSELDNDVGYITKDVNDLTNYTLSSNLSTVATSGDYDDLTNKPTIPTVNDGTLTLQVNGTTVNTFTANSSTNVTTNITVPTHTSNLTNDSGYINNTVNNLTNYTNNTNLATLFSDFLNVVEETISIGSLSAQTGLYDQVFTLTVPTGYTLVGLVGFQFIGVGSASINLGRYYTRNTNQFVYSLYNTTTSGSSANDTTLRIYVLYRKS